MSSEAWEKRIEEQLAAIRQETRESRHITPVAVSKTGAAEMLSCSPDHIAKMVKSGLLHPRNLDGVIRILVSEIYELLENPKTAEPTKGTKRARFDPEAFKAAVRKARNL